MTLTGEREVVKQVARWPELESVLEQLRPVALLDERDHQHWVYGDDEGLDYCEDCCRKRVAELSVKNPNKQFMVDGGWGYMDSDTPATCEMCHCELTYTLTEYGTLEEFDHFKMRRQFDFTCPEVCFALVAILDGFWENQIKPTRGMKSFVKRLARLISTTKTGVAA